MRRFVDAVSSIVRKLDDFSWLAEPAQPPRKYDSSLSSPGQLCPNRLCRHFVPGKPKSCPSCLTLLKALIVVAFLFPSRSSAQQHIHFRIATPRAKASPMYTRISRYLPDMKVYERWWREISECQGLPLPPEHVRLEWVHVNAIHFVDADRDTADSDGEIWWALGKSYLATGVVMIALPYKYDEQVIKHEMTHWLIYWAGEKNREDHPPLHFDGSCGVYPAYKRR